jgi:hypothetical protein
MKALIFILFLWFMYSNLMAEGTAQLRPTTGDLYGNIEFNDQGRPFALESNTDSLHRLYIHIKSTSEMIYFGFQPLDKTLGNGTFRIKDPSGNVVYTRTSIPVTTGAGYIDTYAEAVVGPNIGGTPSNGYTPLSYTPLTTGDYYMEFTTTQGTNTYHFDLFDVTVVDATNKPINGRLWSYAWDLSTQGATNPFNATFYVYSADKYTTSVFFNGFEPWGFVVCCNNKGTQNTGNSALDRQSVDGDHEYPQYKIFFNLPDSTVYSKAQIPTMIQDLAVIGSPAYGSNVIFSLNMTTGGLIEIFLDLDGVPGYQAGNKDVVLVKTIKSGGDTITWNGKDLKGNYVKGNVIVSVTSRFSTGVTHLPIFDDEYNPNGYIINRISPAASRAVVYWDDSQIGGTVNLIGASGNTDEHNFPVFSGGYGNNRTVNTWWNGYENDNLKSFTFTLTGALPINLTSFSSFISGNYVVLEWQTASETDNDFFDIERSSDGYSWESIVQLKAAGNSTQAINYSYIDKSPLLGLAYYRLKQVDFDGNFSHSSIISISNDSFTQRNKSSLASYPNPAVNSITVELGNDFANDFEILTIDGRNITKLITIIKSENSTFSIDISNLDKGTYILNINGDSNLFVKK